MESPRLFQGPDEPIQSSRVGMRRVLSLVILLFFQGSHNIFFSLFSEMSQVTKESVQKSCESLLKEETTYQLLLQARDMQKGRRPGTFCMDTVTPRGQYILHHFADIITEECQHYMRWKDVPFVPNLGATFGELCANKVGDMLKVHVPTDTKDESTDTHENSAYDEGYTPVDVGPYRPLDLTMPVFSAQRRRFHFKRMGKVSSPVKEMPDDILMEEGMLRNCHQRVCLFSQVSPGANMLWCNYFRQAN